MPIGNYNYKPRKIAGIQNSEIEEFLLCLLKDVCTQSSNSILQTQTQVNYEGDLNLADLQKETDVKLLLSFKLVKEDPNNISLNRRDGVYEDILKIRYEIGLIGINSKGLEGIRHQEFTQIMDEIINGLTNNWNGESAQPTPYQATISTGKTLKSDLTLNEASDFPDINRAEDDAQQINYLTGMIKIIFNISI